MRITSITRLEVGCSARNAMDLQDAAVRPPLASMPVAYLTPAMEDRAMAVQATVVERGLHRAASIPDLLVAAAAELARLTVLHVDKGLRAHRRRGWATGRTPRPDVKGASAPR